VAFESTTIYQIASGSRDANDAIETTNTLFGTWTMWQHQNQIDKFGLGFAGENRDNYSGPSFVDMTHDIGTIWSPNDATSDDYTKITQLWFGERAIEGKVTYIVGVIDPGAYLNGNRFASSTNTQFFSQPFATNPARNFPDNGLGAVGRFAPVPWFQLQAEVSNGDAVSTHSPFTSIDGNWFGAGEAVFIPQIPGLGEGRYRFLLYRKDSEGGDTSGWALSFDQNLGERFGAFFRYGNNGGTINPIRNIAAGGISLLQPFSRKDDQAGIAFSWTQPSDSSLRDEYSSEIYYRVQLTNFMEFSPSAQMIYHPSASKDDVIGVFGVRMRFLF
jgi:porin